MGVVPADSWSQVQPKLQRRSTSCIQSGKEHRGRLVPALREYRTQNAFRRKPMGDAMTADQATFLLHDLYMGTLKTESRTTKKILEAVPANKADYKPDPASRSAIELTRHIAASDNRFLETVINGVFETNPAMVQEQCQTAATVASTDEEQY